MRTCRFDTAGGATAPVSTLTSGSNSVGSSKSDRRVTLATIKEEAMGVNSQTAYVQVHHATLSSGSFINQSALLGCP